MKQTPSGCFFGSYRVTKLLNARVSSDAVFAFRLLLRTSDLSLSLLYTNKLTRLLNFSQITRHTKTLCHLRLQCYRSLEDHRATASLDFMSCTPYLKMLNISSEVYLPPLFVASLFVHHRTKNFYLLCDDDNLIYWNIPRRQDCARCVSRASTRGT